MVSQNKLSESGLEEESSFVVSQKSKDQSGTGDDHLVVSEIPEWRIPIFKKHPRLSMQAKLIVGVLVAAIPLIVILITLAWDTVYLLGIGVVSLVSLVVGLTIVVGSQRPLSELADRARNLAGSSVSNNSNFVLLRRDASRSLPRRLPKKQWKKA